MFEFELVTSLLDLRHHSSLSAFILKRSNIYAKVGRLVQWWWSCVPSKFGAV